jgi:fumarylacetoacetase
MTWLTLPANSRYGLEALPYGVFATGGGPARVGVRIGDQVLDLASLGGAIGPTAAAAFGTDSLNAFLRLGRSTWAHTRSRLVELLTDPAAESLVRPLLLELSEVSLQLPIEVADYVDFYASEAHATHLGSIFRPDSPALPVNWKHLPIGYHGRSGTVVVSGTDIVRPCGQRKSPQDENPSYGECLRLDIEAELGFVVGKDSSRPTPVTVDAARDYLFGVVVLNDWSARDIQAWEYVPLGPFLGKSFATSISAWVLPLEALASAEIALPQQRPQPLAYLRGTGPDALAGLDIRLEVTLNGEVISRPRYADMYWSPAQMLAHLTINGATTRVGDLFGSGTISGWQPDRRGSLLELSWGGTEPFTLADGSEHRYLDDGDTVTISAWATGSAGAEIGLGEVTGRVLPALG